MKVTRYINGELLQEKEMPKMVIKNPVVVAMLREIVENAQKQTQETTKSA